ncbi:hypothetical protein H9I32_19140 [Bacillus sp. Xin]|uniref:hypothetical protein n=1 Tax=unclassified Bacillus (in: firmicutes) TaxID=185979 RepID=UPI001572A470|nr:MULTISPECIES: hypothetical protein [unclassified Bacillus (in: firmicutes)]MBC6974418.1 hypothetical protein [Bacillus sp. Xin]NSW34796.1 hypothetical protein [Bacillus sp. Xin1]
MNAKDMVELNNDKRKLLTPENENIYSDMLIYLRFTTVPQKQMEELLLEILDHLLDAQKDEKNAYDIFGEDLKAYCDELIKSSEHQTTFEKGAVIGFAVSLLLAIQFGFDTLLSVMHVLFTDENTSNIAFSIPGTILSAFIFTAGTILTFSLLRRYSFTILASWKQKTMLMLSFCIPFGLSIFTNIYFKTQSYLSFNLTILQGTLVASSFYILYKLLYKTSRF